MNVNITTVIFYMVYMPLARHKNHLIPSLNIDPFKN